MYPSPLAGFLLTLSPFCTAAYLLVLPIHGDTSLLFPSGLVYTPDLSTPVYLGSLLEGMMKAESPGLMQSAFSDSQSAPIESHNRHNPTSAFWGGSGGHTKAPCL